MIIREIINGIKAGWHAGRGHKATRRKEYQKALLHYELALKFEKENGVMGSGPSPVTLECLARTQARLGNYKEALIEAERSHALYKKLDPSVKIVSESISRIGAFINSLKNGIPEDIKKNLNI